MLRLGRGQTGQREQAHLSQQDRGIQLLGGEEVRVGIQPFGIILQPLRVEELEQFVPCGVVRVAERLHGVAVRQVLEDEVGGVGEGGLAGADGEVVRRLGRGFGGGDGAERAEQVGVGFVVVADAVGGVGDLEEEGSLVVFVGVPEPDPGVEVFELGAQDFEEPRRADDAEDGEEDVVAGFGVVREDVEDGGEDGEREAWAVGGGGRDRVAQVGDDFGEEDEEVGGLDAQVDEEVVGCDGVCLGGNDKKSDLIQETTRKTRKQSSIPFSGALFSTTLPVTSFFSASSFFPCSRRGPISDFTLEASGFCFFCISSMYWASSSASSSKTPSINKVLLGAGILLVKGDSP